MKPCVPVRTNIQVDTFDVLDKVPASILSRHTQTRASHSRPARFVLIGILLLISSGDTLGQTSIVAVRDLNEISIGADSKRTFKTFNQDGSVKTQNSGLACKIYRAANVYFGCSGVCAKTNTAKIVIEGLGGPNLFNAKLPAVLPLVQESLDKFLRRQREENEIVYKREYLKGKPVLALLFVGVLNGTPSATAVDFLNDPSDGDVKTRFRVRSLSGQENMMAIGHSDAIRALSSQQKGMLGRLKPADAVESLVRLEIDKESEEVGGPIDILKVTKSGSCWVRHKKEGEGCETDIPECPAVSNPPTPRPRKRIRPR